MKSRLEDQKRASLVGQEIAALLRLQHLPNGRFDTEVGDKTAAGLARTVERVMGEDPYQMITAVNGVTGLAFAVRIVKKGQRYGHDLCKTHGREDPLVEFYDTTYAGDGKFTPLGQFVSRYYLSTLRQYPKDRGLSLDNGIPAWTVTSSGMRNLLPILEKVSEQKDSNKEV